MSGPFFIKPQKTSTTVLLLSSSGERACFLLSPAPNLSKAAVIGMGVLFLRAWKGGPAGGYGARSTSTFGTQFPHPVHEKVGRRCPLVRHVHVVRHDCWCVAANGVVYSVVVNATPTPPPKQRAVAISNKKKYPVVSEFVNGFDIIFKGRMRKEGSKN